MITIYDGNNWVRIQLLNDFNGLGMRSLWEEVCKPSADPKFFVFDGRGSNQKRRDLYPKYKMNRDYKEIDTFFENLEFFKELLVNAPKNVFHVDAEGYEGDDIIASLCKMFYPQQVTVMSTDKDLTQIENATLPMANNDFCPKKYVHLYKTLVGDPSDNITGLRGFGKASWEKLTEHEKDILNAWFRGKISNDGIEERFLKNEEDLRIMWKITGFFYPEIELKGGDGNTHIVEKKLQELFL